MRARTGHPGELALIEKIRTRAGQATTRSRIVSKDMNLGIGDDCALLRIRSDEELAVTTDLSIDGRHFRLDWHPPESIGHRALARGLSDLAAMGSRPVAAFLSLGLPKALVSVVPKKLVQNKKKEWLERFLDGFFDLAGEFNTPLAGGDLAESPIALANIVLAGAVQRGKALLRSGARPGDLLYVTGTLGGAAAAFDRLAQWAETKSRKSKTKPGSAPPRIPARLQPLVAPHLFPRPRITQGAWLARNGAATSAIDLSDGLSTDLAHLCAESHAGAEIDATALPVHPGATLEQALHGGEDYELLFTAPPAARIPRRIAGVPVSRIGQMVRAGKSRSTVVLVTAKGTQPLAPQGWEHFS